MSHRPHMSRPYMSHHVTNPVRLDSDQFRAGNGTNQFVYFHALKTSHDTKSSHSLGNRQVFTRGKMQVALTERSASDDLREEKNYGPMGKQFYRINLGQLIVAEDK